MSTRPKLSHGAAVTHSFAQSLKQYSIRLVTFIPFIVRFRAIVCWCFPLRLLQLFFAVAGVCMALVRSYAWAAGNALLAEGNDRGVNLLNLPSGVALFPLSLGFIALLASNGMAFCHKFSRNALT